LIAAFFTQTLVCSNTYESVVSDFIKSGYLDELYGSRENYKNQIYLCDVSEDRKAQISKKWQAQVDVKEIIVSSEFVKMAIFDQAKKDYAEKAAEKYPMAPANFDFKSYIDDHLLTVGENKFALLMQYVLPGHNIQIIIAEMKK
jgi:hypothetical protein